MDLRHAIELIGVAATAFGRRASCLVLDVTPRAWLSLPPSYSLVPA
jgi:hypothetical protein